MDRNELQMFGNGIMQEYGRMLTEMTLAETPARIAPRQAPYHSYVQVTEVSRRFGDEDARPVWESMAQLMHGLSSVAMPFSLVLASDGKALSTYVGTDQEHMGVLMGMLLGVFPQMRLASNDLGHPVVRSYHDIHGGNLASGGFVRGNPVGYDDPTNPSQVDAVIRGMAGRPWVYAVFAQPEPVAATVRRQQRWLARATECSALAQVTFTDSDNSETLSYQQRYVQAEQYVQKVEAFSEHSFENAASGEWCVVCNYAASTTEDARLLGGLLTAAFYGAGSEPEVVHAVVRHDDARVPLVDGWEFTHAAYLGNEAFPRYATLLSCRELAVYASLPATDTAGLAVVDDVAFDVDREVSGDLVVGSILDAGRPTQNAYALPSDELNRHALVVGLTGSGKTNTLKCLLHDLATRRGLPFMVVEPAKKEYWELWRMGFDDLQVYSVGSSEPGARGLCINPFECASVTGPGGRRRRVPIQTHIDFVYAAFKASFIMYTPMPYVLERAIYEIYEDCGWDVQADVNRTGREVYPTIEDLYFKIPEVVDAMGYDQKMRRDLIGSLQARINSLRIGSKGATLNVARSFPFDQLLEGRVVVELEDIGDDDAKAFIISLLLVNLLEVRRQQDDLQLGLRHVMLIEEAHRLLKNVQGGTGEDADPRGAAVEFFCNLLAEMRSKGQGFVVADQIPSKLAPDLVKNTNLKIAHRIVAVDERELVGGSMHMRDEQVEALASLRQGVAAVYSEGDNRPKLVRPAYAGELVRIGREWAGRAEALAATAHNGVQAAGNPDYASLTGTMPEVCRRCGRHCGRRPADVLVRLRDPRAFDRLADRLDPSVTRSCKAGSVDSGVRGLLDAQEPGWETRSPADRACVLACLLDRWQLPKRSEQRLINIYMELG